MDLALDNLRKFFMASGIGLMAASVLAIVYLFERWSAAQWTLIEKVSQYELTTETMTEAQKSFVASCTKLSATVTHGFETGLTLAVASLVVGAILTGHGCAMWTLELKRKKKAAM
jgi:predicted negative regulator of RcsB-dependent stress response